MSAYGNSDAIRQGQIEMLCNDMAKEYEAGNYVLCGGDFNHDLKASEEDTESCECLGISFSENGSCRSILLSAGSVKYRRSGSALGTVPGTQIWNMSPV